MRARRSFLVLATLVATLALATAALGSPRDVLLVSGPNEVTPDGYPVESQIPSISGNGRYVAYIADYTDTGTGLYLRDMLGGVTPVDVPEGAGPSGLGFDVGGPALSISGRYLAYASEDPAISDDDVDFSGTPGGGRYPLRDIFVYDRATGTNTLVSRRSGADGAAANNDSNLPSISAYGRYVAFSTGANNLVPGALVFGGVYVRDLRTNTTRWVAGDRTLEAAGESAMDPSISGDGRKVAYMRKASGLRSAWQIVVRDLRTGETTLASRAGRHGAPAREDCREPAISASGRYVAFASKADNLSGADRDGVEDVFVRDLKRNRTILVSRAAGRRGAPGGGDSMRPSISADGHYVHVAFQSFANNLGPNDNGAVMDVFVKELRSGRVILASRGDAGSGNALSRKPSISADGRFVAFESNSSNLSPDDAKRLSSVFRYQLFP